MAALSHGTLFRLRSYIVVFVPRQARGAGAKVTPEEMRVFALECLAWSEEAGDPSNRDLMVRIAKHWMLTASTVERRVSNGDELVCADLRNKLD
jgi:hypothetical protein